MRPWPTGALGPPGENVNSDKFSTLKILFVMQKNIEMISDE
jgi:hypothetical protein